ncbi:uncharacterized protein LOC124457060 [Xenia sp. Carnegie-2017]|uniref:uncharacterized protein LOC124457060 n=1 Tax=Xenia sp. Carnegie-2017 TaxID=2897299 RepID=UPI001F038B44|nr:uncharacterized protein LOC124457060 [Xenia sp. Carnegie-2017]
MLERFAQHFDQLLNLPGNVDSAALASITQRPTVHVLDEPPKMDELLKAIAATKESKAPGCCGIPAEVWKYGGTTLKERLLDVIGDIWIGEKIPQDWKDANIVPIFKKGSRKECGNYRGIFYSQSLGRRLVGSTEKFGCTDKIINLVKAFHEGMQAKVTRGSDCSEGFAVSTGVKQGCVLAPTLFSFYLAAMLEVAFEDTREGIYIQTRHDGNLFNASHFKAKTRTTRQLVRDMLFADDCALVAHSAAEMQALVDKFAQAAAMFSLKINIKKTECLYQPVKLLLPPPKPCAITIDGQPLVQTTDFNYLGSTISSNAKIEKELRNRMGRASAAFSQLNDRLWQNKHVSTRVKAKVYQAVVLTTLLYGAEAWTIYRLQVKKLSAYMMRHLRDILKISWRDKIANAKILRLTDLPHMADMLIQKNLRWISHVHRMERSRLPRQLLYSQLVEGKRNQGRPRLRLKDVMKRNLKRRDINVTTWKQLADNRPAWRASIQP